MSTLKSVCVYCGSSTAALASHLDLAERFGAELGRQGLRLVYGGTDIGLMGRCARGARGQGGLVLGVIPEFLTTLEPPFEDCELRRVRTMAERKHMMAEEADAFVVLPGGVGTLEETIETLSWRRLNLHDKPLVFLAEDDFWAPLKALFRGMADARLLNAEFAEELLYATTPKEALEVLRG